MLIKDESGQGLTEYLILLVLVAVVSIGAATTLGSTVEKKLKTAREHINERVRFPSR